MMQNMMKLVIFSLVLTPVTSVNFRMLHAQAFFMQLSTTVPYTEVRKVTAMQATHKD